MFKGLNQIMESICAGIQRPLQLKSLPLWVLTGFCDPEQCGVISQILILGPLNNEPHPRHKFIA